MLSLCGAWTPELLSMRVLNLQFLVSEFICLKNELLLIAVS